MSVPVFPVTQGRTIRTCAIGGFLITESRYAPATVIGIHSHQRASIAIAVSGSFVESLGAEVLECASFDAMVKPAGEAHANHYGRSGAHCLLIEADSQRIESLSLFHRTTHVRAPHIAMIASRLHRELTPGDDVWEVAAESAVLELVAAISRAPGGAPDCVTRAREFIAAHWNAKLSLTHIAAAAGTSRSTLVRAFRIHLQCSPAAYIRRLRLEHAEEELRRGEKSVSEIALQCGFYDQSHFTNAFRRFRGVTPGVWASLFPNVRRLS